jgi:ABC-type hemin transport system ATPase subunit
MADRAIFTVGIAHLQNDKYALLSDGIEQFLHLYQFFDQPFRLLVGDRRLLLDQTPSA